MTGITTFLAAWCAADSDGDTSTLDRQLTEDFLGVGPLGFSLPKPAWLTRHHGGRLRYTSFTLDDLVGRSYGETAVVTARQHTDGTFEGHPLPTDLRTTLVLVGPTGSRRLAAAHMSFVAGTPGAPPLPGGLDQEPGTATAAG